MERLDLLAEEIAPRVSLTELPADLQYFALDGEQVYITARTNKAEYARRHPPRCIRELNPVLLAKPTAGPPDDENADFRVSCPCGQRACYVLGYLMEDEGPTREITKFRLAATLSLRSGARLAGPALCVAAGAEGST